MHDTQAITRISVAARYILSILRARDKRQSRPRGCLSTHNLADSRPEGLRHRCQRSMRVAAHGRHAQRSQLHANTSAKPCEAQQPPSKRQTYITPSWLPGGSFQVTALTACATWRTPPHRLPCPALPLQPTSSCTGCTPTNQRGKLFLIPFSVPQGPRAAPGQR